MATDTLQTYPNSEQAFGSLNTAPEADQSQHNDYIDKLSGPYAPDTVEGSAEALVNRVDTGRVFQQRPDGGVDLVGMAQARADASYARIDQAEVLRAQQEAAHTKEAGKRAGHLGQTVEMLRKHYELAA